MNLIQLGLDAGILALCCEVVFRQKAEIKAKDFFVFPILLVLCVVPRVDFSIGANMTASFRSEGFEILPADNIVGLLFLIFAVLLLSSIFFGSKSSGTVFCGTMAAFSVFLFVKCLCVVLFAVCGATDILLLLGSRAAALCLIVVLEFTPLFGLIHQLVQRSDFTILIVSTNIAVLLMTVLSILSFDVDRLLANLWIINILILAVLLLDSILLFLHQRRIQEQKRIHMIEQYVPIVEELISQVRARQHEFNNRMMAIEAAVTSADTIEEARKEVTALTGSIGISLNDRELLSCDSKMIAGMLFGKIKQAEAANHHIELSLHGLFKKTVTPETEWIEVIGILLDNAIEASPKGSTIFLSSKKQGDFLELTVSNPAPPLSNTEFMALFGKGVTTKTNRDGHGFGLYTVTFGNDKMGSLLIVKKDAVTGAPISDVEFFITDSDGSVIGNANGKYVTDSAGTIRIDDLTPGMTVIACEVRAKDGYILDDTPQSIKIKRNAVMTLEFRNQPKGGVLVKKVDAVTNAPISDVEFLVTDSDGNLIGNSNGKFVTDSAGTFTITDIAPGTTLIIKETRAKAGYILDDTPQTVKVKSNEVTTMEFRNAPKGNLIIVKQDSVTKEPLEGVEFKIVYADGSYVDAEGGTLSSTGLYRTDKEGKITISGISGTIVATEVQTIPGYAIDENTRTQTVVVNPNDTQTLHFYNTPIGGVEIIKVNEDNHSERIPNTTFEIRKVDDALVDTVTTDKNGRVFVALEDGSYYAKEVTSNKSFRLDDTPHYFEIKDGKHVTLQVTNKKLSGIVIHKIDSATGEGIYGVKFVLYDANKKPIGEYTSDDEGYIYIDEIPGGLSGRFYLRELEAAPGYTLDKQYKTVYVSPGKTVEIEWENTAVTGQIQIYKYAAEYNEVTGTAAGTPLKGAVYEIVNARSGKVVDYITTDARGVAASKPLPLTRYQLREVTAPAYWQLDPTVHDVTLEYPGQIIKLSAYDKPSSLGVSITKRGNAQVMAGQSMRYDLTVANTSNVPLESFFWHDKIPYDVARPTTLTTGTYSARLNYRVLYKTNYNASYQVLASNLLTSNNYSFSLNAIPMQAGEVVTDIYFDFGKVPVGFQSTVNPTLSVMVNGNAVNGYQMVNRADVGGKYQGTWQTATASWVTVIRRLWGAPTLPKTGY